MKAKTEHIARGSGNNCILTYLMLQHEGRTAKHKAWRGLQERGVATHWRAGSRCLPIELRMRTRCLHLIRRRHLCEYKCRCVCVAVCVRVYVWQCVCACVFVLSESKLKLESPSISKTRRKWSVKTAKEANKKTRLQWKRKEGAKGEMGGEGALQRRGVALSLSPFDNELHWWRCPSVLVVVVVVGSFAGRVYRLLFAWPTLRTAAIIDATVAATAATAAAAPPAAPTAAAASPACPQFGLHFTKSSQQICRPTTRHSAASAFAIWAPKTHLAKLRFSFFIFLFLHFVFCIFVLCNTLQAKALAHHETLMGRWQGSTFRVW